MTWTELHEAAEHQDFVTVQNLATVSADQACNVDAFGSTPLHLLLWGSNPSIEAVNALIHAYPQALTDTNVHGDTPLHMACRSPTAQKHLIQTLLDACPTAVSMINHEGLMPLHVALRYAPQNESVIGLLIDVYPYALRSHIKIGEPAPSGHKDVQLREGTTKDHAIIDPTEGMATKDIIDLKMHADKAMEVRDGAYPIHLALTHRAPLSVVEMILLEAPDMLLCTNKFSETPLHVALKMGQEDKEREEVILTVLKQGPDACRVATKLEGNLPIHTALAFGCHQVHVVKALLEAWPASIQQRNKQGLTPLELATLSESKCCEEVVRLLEIMNESFQPTE